MKALSIYISLLFFTVCLAAPSVVVLSDLKVKETKVAKLFDMEEEEDARDTDTETETEKENNLTQKFFKSIFISVVMDESFHITLNHYHFYQRSLSEPVREITTPPPRPA